MNKRTVRRLLELPWVEFAAAVTDLESLEEVKLVLQQERAGAARPGYVSRLVKRAVKLAGEEVRRELDP